MPAGFSWNDGDSFDDEGQVIVTDENTDQADVALKTTIISVMEIKKKLKAEIMAHECAEKAAGGWSTVAFLENKDLNKLVGETMEEKEEKNLLINKAEEEFKKHAKSKVILSINFFTIHGNQSPRTLSSKTPGTKGYLTITDTR